MLKGFPLCTRAVGVKLGAVPFGNGPVVLRSHWSEAAAPGLLHPWAPHFRCSEQRRDKVSKHFTLVIVIIIIIIIIIIVIIVVETGAAVILT